MKAKRASAVLILGIVASVVLVWALSGGATPAYADPRILYVAMSGEENANPCTDPGQPCRTISNTVGNANDGDEIRVAAGVYTDVFTVGGLSQVVHVDDKSVTIRGGFTTTNWTDYDPVANITEIDAQGNGRGIYISGPYTVTIEGLSITGGNATGLGGVTAGDGGGGIYVDTAKAIVSDSLIIGNIASTSDYGKGGGICLLNSTSSEVVNSRVFSNTASTANNGYGGGIYAEDSTVEVVGNHVYHNTASTTTISYSGYGGGLRFDNVADAMLVDNWIGHNTASAGGQGFGGGLSFSFGHGSTVAINRVFSNTAGIASSSYGGGVHLYGSDAVVEGNEIWDNIACSPGTGLGGGIFANGGTPTIRENTIHNNTAGGTSFNYGGGIDLDDSEATVEANLILGNQGSPSANGMGGGVSVRNSDNATLHGNLVFSNTAAASVDGFGGGIYLYNSDATLSANRVRWNIASVTSWGHGGGIYMLECSPDLTNDMVADNQAHGTGGVGAGIHVNGSSPHVEHATIANNTGGDGSGIHVYSGSGGPWSNAYIINCIVSGHTVGVSVTTYSQATLNTMLYWNNDTHHGGPPGAITFIGSEYVGDPRFIPLAGDDYHIGSGSAALDRGYPNSIATDIDNAPRAQGSGTDLGADEATFVNVPLILRRN